MKKIIIEGNVEVHIGKGRPRAEYTTQIRKDMNKENNEDLK